MSSEIIKKTGKTKSMINNNDFDIKKFIIKKISENCKITRKEIANELNVSVKTVERAIKSIDNLHYVNSGIIGYWEFKDSKRFDTE